MNTHVLAALAAGLMSASPPVMADANQAPGAPTYHYTYHKQAKPLRLDPTRLAVQADREAAVAAALGRAGLGAAKWEAHAIAGWWVVSEIGPADAARIEALVAALAAAPEIQFASPIFFDDLGGPMWPTNTLMLGFAGEAAPAQQQEALAAAGPIRLLDQPPAAGVHFAEAGVRSGFEALAAANALAGDPRLLFAEPDMVFTGQGHVIPNDPMFSQLWGLHNTGQSGGTVDFDMDIPEAWDVHAGSASIIAVVIDTGVDLTHPDLNLAGGNDLTGNNTLGGPGNNCDNHGTQVAGCISGRSNNSVGIAGAAPGCRVAPARCMISNTSCNGSWTSQASWTVNALNWAQNIGARVTNNSNGYGFTSGAIETAYSNTYNAGIVHFASAGNDGVGSLGYPARVSTVNAVAALNRFGNRAGFSQFGSGLDFSAPGVSIVTTDRQGAFGGTSTDFATVDGTSFASPYAAAVACLLLSRRPALTAAEVEAVMKFNCTDLGAAGYDTDFGFGCVNAQRTLNHVVPLGDGCTSAATVTAPGAYSGTLDGAGNPTFVSGVCGSSGGHPDVWRRFVAPSDGTLIVSTCGTHDGPGVDAGIDTVLSLHADCGQAALSCNDDTTGCGGADINTVRDASVSRSMVAGQSILIRISRYQTSNLGPFTLNVSFFASNDPCAGAIDVSSGGTWFGNLAHASSEGAVQGACGLSGSNPDAWYRYTAPAGCPVTLNVSTCGTHDTGGVDAGMDTVLSLHSACGAAVLTCTDDAACGSLDSGAIRDSQISRSLAPGETIYIRVSKFNTSPNRSFRLNVSATTANDACSAAVPLSPGVPAAFCNQSASTDGPAESACLSGGDNQVRGDLWYTYTPSGPGRFTVSTCGSSFNTKVAIYGGTCPLPSAPNQALACNDNAGAAACPSGPSTSRVSAVGVAGATYLIRVGGQGNSGGAGVVTVFCAADFNLSGAASVQDIFDFLSAYFMNSPDADANGSGSVSVQDIFDFLSSYFAGCQ